MRIIVPLMLACGLVFTTIDHRAAADDRSDATPGSVEARFRAECRPFLETYCVGCHGHDKPKGDLDLSAFTSADSVARDLPHWELVREQLEAGSMPPAKAKRKPSLEARSLVIAWIGAVRKLEATRHAGDPGLVPARRLSNAEYDNTVRDLTGVDMRPTREFPVDPANEAGFDNSAESLAMSPALAKKYLEAARDVADHLVLKPDGLRLRALPDARRHRPRQVRRQGGSSTSTRRKIRTTPTISLPPGGSGTAQALGQPEASLDAFAAEPGASRKYLATIWSLLNESSGRGRPDRRPPDPSGGSSPDLRTDRELRRGRAASRCGTSSSGSASNWSPEVKNLTAPGNQHRAAAIRSLEEPPVCRRTGCDTPAARRRIQPADLNPGRAAARALASPEDG